MFKLVLLQYIDRSGSSYLVNQLSKNKLIFVFPEAGNLNYLLLKNPYRKYKKNSSVHRSLIKLATEHFQLNKWPIKDVLNGDIEDMTHFEVFLLLLKRYIFHEKTDKSVWIFKFQYTPGVVNYISRNKIKDFKFLPIYLFRDPRAICNSQLHAVINFPQLKFSRNPVILIRKWKRFYEEASSKIMEEKKLILKYEDLILNTNQIISLIASYLHIDINLIQNSNAYYSKLTKIEKQLHTQIILAPQTDRIDAWKNELPGIYIDLIESFLLCNNEYFGYGEVKKNKRLISRLGVTIYGMYLLIRIGFRIDKG